jgi:glyoxylase-like metal-dependent hydrolase (beta-lactamase superfamily II)
VRVHVLDCGHLQVKDLASFSDTGEYDGKPGALADPCFLIQHPKGLLLWDAGLGDRLAGKPADKQDPFGPTVSITLESQLTKLGLSPKDIQFIAFSHSHWDHTGNANLFLDATWLWQDKELKHSLSENPLGVRLDTFDQFRKVKQTTFHGDYDVFGDGKVKILFTPGHSPGHQCLFVQLSKQPVILSGDLYHLKDSRTHRRVPTFNSSRADTLASMDRIETISKNRKARVIVQHDPKEYDSLPKFPRFLE